MNSNNPRFKRLRNQCVLVFILLIPILLLSPNIFSQVTEEWVARYNGPGNSEDSARAIAVDSSGNVYVTGSSYGSGTSTDYATIKYNSAGVQQWVARYNGPGNNEDDATDIALDSSGNIYVTGWSIGSGTDFYDYATIKYNSSGVEEWVARYNGLGYEDTANGIALDNSGNVYVTGLSYSSRTDRDYATIKYNNAGVQQWVARYIGPEDDFGCAWGIALDSSGNVYVTGWSIGSGTGWDYATIKYNSSGVEQWVARYNGQYDDKVDAIAVDSSGNVYVTGRSWGSGTSYDCATIKYNGSGVQQWVVRYNDPENRGDGAEAIVLDSSGNVYVTGYSYSLLTDCDYVTIKYNSSGVQQWVARYKGPGNDYDYASAIALDSSGNVYVTGVSDGSGTSEDYATIKYNTSGVEQWVARYNGPGNDGDVAEAIVLDSSGNVYVTGTSYISGTYPNEDYDYATIKYSQGTLIRVKYPNGGEIWQGGTIHDINWISSNDITGDVRITLWKGNSLYNIITSSTENDGSYSWSIPNSLPEGSDYRIRITSNSTGIYDFSDNYFTITKSLSNLINFVDTAVVQSVGTSNLVVDKPTVIRVFISSVIDQNPVNITGELQVVGPTSNQFISPIPLKISTSAKKFNSLDWTLVSIRPEKDGSPSASLNFYFIPKETGQYNFIVTIKNSNGQNILEPINLGERLNKNWVFKESSWNDTRPMRILFQPVAVLSKGVGNVNNVAEPTRKDAAAMLPLCKVEKEILSIPVICHSPFDISFLLEAFPELALSRVLYNENHKDNPADYIVGVFPKGSCFFWDLGGEGIGRVAIVEDDEEFIKENHTGVHELGHCLGLKHPWEDKDLFPGITRDGQTRIVYIPEYGGVNLGSDLQAIQIDPDNYMKTKSYVIHVEPNSTLPIGYLMDYFFYTWISRQEYNKLFDRMMSGIIGPSKLNVLEGSTGQYLSLALLIGKDNTASVIHSYLHNYNELLLPESGDDYLLVIKDSVGNELASYGFTVTFVLDFGSNTLSLDSNSVYFNIPWPDTAKYFEVRCGVQNILTSAISNNAPTVIITTPNSGPLPPGIVTVEWTANDIDGDELKFDLLWSKDGGVSFSPIEFGLTSNSFDLPTDNLPGTNQGVLRVVASDGFNTGYDDTNGFLEVGRKNPTVNINKPNDGDIYLESDSILFEGTGTDIEDGFLISENYYWSSNLEGSLGQGESLLVNNLSIGNHQITLAVKDSDGNEAINQIQINILADTDSDGMPDEWENQYTGLNPNINDSSFDLDNDGLINILEYKYGTNPTLADTDGDGYNDFEEILLGSDPKDPHSHPTIVNENIWSLYN